MEEIRLIVTHEGCPDGIASAMILASVMGGVEVVAVQYNTPAWANLQVRPGMLFVDMSPPAARVEEFVEAGAWCLDHHKHAEQVVAAFGARGVYAEEQSGATLAFDFVQGQIKDSATYNMVAQFAHLARIRDLWGTGFELWPQACAQAEALRFWGLEYLLPARRGYLLPHEFEAGSRIVHRTAETVRRVVDQRLFETVLVGGSRVAVVPGVDCVSDVANGILEARLADVVVVAFLTHDGEGVRLVQSVRSKGVDVGAACKACGGGGHATAAGCAFDAPTPISPQLVAELRRAILADKTG